MLIATLLGWYVSSGAWWLVILWETSYSSYFCRIYTQSQAPVIWIWIHI